MLSMNMKVKNSITILLITFSMSILTALPSAAFNSQVNYLPYEEAKPILEALRDVLPPELKNANPADLPTVWQKWVASRDRDIRSRLLQGDEDSLINFLLFGTTFTRRPRITLNALVQAGRDANSPEADTTFEAIKLRSEDLIQGIFMPGNNERLLFAKRLVEAKGYDLKLPATKARLREYLFDNLVRVLNEQSSYAKILERARLLGDVSQEFAERSKLYTGRGLSSDTSLLPNYALEKSLQEIKSQNLLAPGSVRRIAIVGPGLDFTDKQDGYDFYPQQTIQPFAMIDTLLRLGLARASDLQVTTFDLSPRINDHLMRSKLAAQRGQGYRIQLPRDEQATWKAESLEYWKRFGDQIGTPVTPVVVPASASGLKVRAVNVRPAIVGLITPQDLNVVLQRMERPAGTGFDLIIATNILVYYDVFEQSLAMANVEKMLRPGGFLLSNNALLELPSSTVHSVNYTTVVYSERADDGDHIVWYQRAAK
jgi:hypothetical protein